MKLKLDASNRPEAKGGAEGTKKRMRALGKLRSTPRASSLLLFFVFIVIAAALWLITATNNDKNSGVELIFPLKYKNLTGEYAFETEPPKQVEVKLNVTGFPLLRYSLRPKRDTLSLFVTEEDIQKKRFRVPEGLMKERIAEKLPGNVNIVSISPTSISIPFYRRSSKTVPVVHQILADERSGFLLSPISVEPTSITVYGSRNNIDTVKAAYTVPITLKDIHANQTLSIALRPIASVIFSTDSVQAEIRVEELTEQSMELPITVINEPSNYRVRLLPAIVTIQIVIPTSLYNQYKADEFEPVVDYNDILSSGDSITSDLLNVELRRIPETVNRYTVSPSRVQFILEERKGN